MPYAVITQEMHDKVQAQLDASWEQFCEELEDLLLVQPNWRAARIAKYFGIQKDSLEQRLRRRGRADLLERIRNGKA